MISSPSIIASASSVILKSASRRSELSACNKSGIQQCFFIFFCDKHLHCFSCIIHSACRIHTRRNRKDNGSNGSGELPRRSTSSEREYRDWDFHLFFSDQENRVVRFSPVIGTISAAIAMATRSRYIKYISSGSERDWQNAHDEFECYSATTKFFVRICATCLFGIEDRDC